MMKGFSLLFLMLVSLRLTTSCPSKNALLPCVCESEDINKLITCDGLDNDASLAIAVKALVGIKDIYSLTIENSFLNYLPHDFFEGIELVELEFKTTSLMSFTDTDVAFVGLEDSLEILLVTDCSLMNSWDWSLLRNMHKLIRLDIVGGDMESISEEVKAISSLNMIDLSFTRNRISHVYEHAFSNFTELRFLSLKDNVIRTLKRSMLPNPAEKLMDLDFGYNKIESLPPDMFTNMPNLELISISGNKILSLREETFSPVWEQLEFFSAMGNELICDCMLSWILKLKRPRVLRAICIQPLKFKKQDLAQLTSKDLWCF